MAERDIQWEQHRVRAYLTLGEVGRVEISRMEVAYPYNSIPVLEALVPLGKDYSTSSSQTERLLRSLAQYQTVEAVVEIDDEQRTVFTGYLNGVVLKRKVGGAAIMLRARHWLCLLDSSSPASRLFTAATPAGVFAARTALSEQVSADLAGTRAYVAALSELAGGDLWTAIEAVVRDVATHSMIDPQLGATLGRWTDLDNTPALQVLERITGHLSLAGIPYPEASYSIAANIAGAMLAPQNRTIWQALRLLAQEFFFAVLPQAEEAQVVPLVPVPETPPPRVLELHEYSSITYPQPVRQTVRRVQLLSPALSSPSFNADDTYPRPTPQHYDSGEPGMIHVQLAPRWVYPLFDSRKVLEDSSQGYRVTGKRQADSFGGATRLRNTQLQGESFSRYAQLVFQYLNYRGEMTLLMPLRFDMVPGVHYGVQVPGTEERLYGLSRSVILVVDSIGRAATTAVNLGFVYTEQDFRYGLDHHPLFAAFDGSSLVLCR